MGRKIFFNHADLPYLITVRANNREWFHNDLTPIWRIMTQQLFFLHHAFDVRIHAFILMSNHFHCIVRTPQANLGSAMRFFMTETSRDINRIRGRINHAYGNRYHRSLLKSHHYYLHAYKYLYRNPVQAGICDKVEDYAFSSLPGLIGQKLEIPISEDENWSSLQVAEETLMWLNRPTTDEKWQEVKKALSKSVFKFSAQSERGSSLEKELL